ncbi:AGE family epimerase/isomerase [Acetobacter cibinongensis]|uniref:AGE family epimerase/isomerase n=1 Tax=Acetobacter cibinongensis TaxID=146475 RepID=UPI000A386D03|nr:AGE family epimerase/isomerase [Acetobacter cibinongensis]
MMVEQFSPEHPSLQEVHQQFRHWLFDQALPFWATVGCDGSKENPAQYGAQESLTLAGEPALPPFKRVRVQARQLFVFSWAVLQGQTHYQACADGIFRFLLKAQKPEGGWVCSLTPDGAVLDPTADLYDLAFVVFALAWYARVEPDGQAVSLARQTVLWIEHAMSTPEGGFLNSLPQPSEPRQQNPHMHLFEAVLALYETTQNPTDLALGHTLYALFTKHFQDTRTGTLGEFFTQDWHPASGMQGQWVEPGHHFEWVWLLSEYERLAGVETGAQARRLYDFATRHGVKAETALVYDALDRDGAVLKASSRLWVQGEALRGVLVFDPQDQQGLVARMVRNLLERYFKGCPAGTWLDQMDEKGLPTSHSIPTSSLYHITTAFAALDKAVTSAPLLPSRAGTACADAQSKTC